MVIWVEQCEAAEVNIKIQPLHPDSEDSSLIAIFIKETEGGFQIIQTNLSVFPDTCKWQSWSILLRKWQIHVQNGNSYRMSFI